MKEQTTRDLGKYVAKGRVNMPADVPSKPANVSVVHPMCERCGVRREDVISAKYNRHPLTPSRWWTCCPPCWGQLV